MRRVRPACLSFAFVVGLAGCQGSEAMDPSPMPGVRTPMVALTGRVECGGPCTVELYDGNMLRPLAIGSDGAVTVPLSAAGGEEMLFISAPGQVPQVKAVGAGRPVGLVRLAPAPDPATGYLALAAVRVSAGGKRVGGLRVDALPQARFELVRGEERTSAVTDQGGAAVVPLQPGRYSVEMAGTRREVEVPQGGTAVLPLVLARRMVD